MSQPRRAGDEREKGPARVPSLGDWHCPGLRQSRGAYVKRPVAYIVAAVEGLRA